MGSTKLLVGFKSSSLLIPMDCIQSSSLIDDVLLSEVEVVFEEEDEEEELEDS
jgi:hypothetical protein